MPSNESTGTYKETRKLSTSTILIGLAFAVSVCGILYALFIYDPALGDVGFEKLGNSPEAIKFNEELWDKYEQWVSFEPIEAPQEVNRIFSNVCEVSDEPNDEPGFFESPEWEAVQDKAYLIGDISGGSANFSLDYGIAEKTGDTNLQFNVHWDNEPTPFANAAATAKRLHELLHERGPC